MTENNYKCRQKTGISLFPSQVFIRLSCCCNSGRPPLGVSLSLPCLSAPRTICLIGISRGSSERTAQSSSSCQSGGRMTSRRKQDFSEAAQGERPSNLHVPNVHSNGTSCLCLQPSLKMIQHVDFSHQWGINLYIRWFVIINALYLSVDYLIMNKLKTSCKQEMLVFIDCANAEKWQEEKKRRMRPVMLKNKAFQKIRMRLRESAFMLCL